MFVPWENSSKLFPPIIRLLLVFAILLEFQVDQEIEIAVGLLFVNLCLFFYLKHVVYLVYLARDEIVIAS